MVGGITGADLGLARVTISNLRYIQRFQRESTRRLIGGHVVPLARLNSTGLKLKGRKINIKV